MQPEHIYFSKRAWKFAQAQKPIPISQFSHYGIFYWMKLVFYGISLYSAVNWCWRNQFGFAFKRFLGHLEEYFHYFRVFVERNAEFLKRRRWKLRIFSKKLIASLWVSTDKTFKTFNSSLIYLNWKDVLGWSNMMCLGVIGWIFYLRPFICVL